MIGAESDTPHASVYRVVSVVPYPRSAGGTIPGWTILMFEEDQEEQEANRARYVFPLIEHTWRVGDTLNMVMRGHRDDRSAETSDVVESVSINGSPPLPVQLWWGAPYQGRYTVIVRLQ